MTSFLVDQQLPKALATFLSERGHDARHIKEYDGGTTMPDSDIARLADSEDRFVVTKDDDFRIAHNAALAAYEYVEINRAGVFIHDRD